MARIKGDYIAVVHIALDCDENREGVLPFEKIKANIKESFSSDLKSLIQDEFDENEATVNIIQLYADVRREDNESHGKFND